MRKILLLSTLFFFAITKAMAQRTVPGKVTEKNSGSGRLISFFDSRIKAPIFVAWKKWGHTVFAPIFSISGRKNPAIENSNHINGFGINFGAICLQV